MTIPYEENIIEAILQNQKSLEENIKTFLNRKEGLENIQAKENFLIESYKNYCSKKQASKEINTSNEEEIDKIASILYDNINNADSHSFRRGLYDAIKPIHDEKLLKEISERNPPTSIQQAIANENQNNTLSSSRS